MSKILGGKEFQPLIIMTGILYHLIFSIIVLGHKLNLKASQEVWTGMNLGRWKFQVAELYLCWTLDGMVIAWVLSSYTPDFPDKSVHSKQSQPRKHTTKPQVTVATCSLAFSHLIGFFLSEMQ